MVCANLCAVNEGVDDVKVKAVNEMMERIKHGVVLRPVKGQDTKVKISVISDYFFKLSGILNTINSEEVSLSFCQTIHIELGFTKGASIKAQMQGSVVVDFC